jgi:hypothetical protein
MIGNRAFRCYMCVDRLLKNVEMEVEANMQKAQIEDNEQPHDLRFSLSKSAMFKNLSSSAKL